MSIDINKIHRALEILGVGEHSIKGDSIENEADFYLKFYLKTGVDDKGRTISTNDKSVHNVQWSDVESKCAEFDNLAYQEARSREYPSIAYQLDYIYHNGIDKWKTDVVDPVKVKHPKPS